LSRWKRDLRKLQINIKQSETGNYMIHRVGATLVFVNLTLRASPIFTRPSSGHAYLDVGARQADSEIASSPSAHRNDTYFVFARNLDRDDEAISAVDMAENYSF
jgi:hypothetical protein